MIPVYILKRVPGATDKDTVEWTDICHRKDAMVYINHESTYEVSRWHHQPRKRPFVVYYFSGRGRSIVYATPWSYHATLAAAEKAARKVAKQYEVAA